MKPDVDALLTLPIDPPGAGPDRAFDPPAPDPEGLGDATSMRSGCCRSRRDGRCGARAAAGGRADDPECPGTDHDGRDAGGENLVDLREKVSLREALDRLLLFDGAQRRAETWGVPCRS